MKIALLTGGPSLERCISLNSARSVLDHLSDDNIEIIPIYFNQQKKAYKISPDQLYSNTPSDFDFKLSQNSSLSQKSLIKLLKSTDIIFPAMHGPFGEDGQIQAFLEKNKIKKAIVKPANGGSSIGVFPAYTPKEALEKTNLIFSKRIDTKVVLEPFAEGREFTVIILENKFQMPVSLMVTEIEPFKEGQIFDFRKKYLPTNQVKYHYPARFDAITTERI